MRREALDALAAGGTGRTAVLAGGAMLAAILLLCLDHWVRLGTVIVVLATVILLLGLIRTVAIYRLHLAAEERVRDGALSAAHALAAAVDAKDHYTRNHSARVALYVAAIAVRMRWPMDRVEPLIVAGHLHDVGKIAVPDAILLKPSLLSEEEFELVKAHSEEGERIVRRIDQPDLGRWIRHHHERWDGGGYPDGLRAAQIPIESRVICAADAFDAMTSTRSYKASLSLDEAAEELVNNAGTQFDPVIAGVLVDLLTLGVLSLEGSVAPEATYTITTTANGHLDRRDYERLATLLGVEAGAREEGAAIAVREGIRT